MSKDYEPYSEFKKKEKARKEHYLKLGIMGMLGIAVACGIFWLGGKLFDGREAKEAAAPKQSTVVVQNKTDTSTAGQQNKADNNNNATNGLFGDAKYLIHIHKLQYKLELFEKGKAEPIKVYNIAVAKNDGDKQKPGDNRTPTSWGNAVAIPKSYEGAKSGENSAKVPFRVEEIINASSWSHDFHDGKGVIQGAYGPWFISLDTGWDGIGIHGTHDPSSIGTKASEGCIRLQNHEVKELKEIICSYNKGIGTRVVITED